MAKDRTAAVDSRTIDLDDAFEVLPKPFWLAGAVVPHLRSVDAVPGYQQAVRAWIAHGQLGGRSPASRRVPLYIPRSGRVDRTAETILTAIEGRYDGSSVDGPSPRMAAAVKEFGDQAPHIGRAAAEVLGISNSAEAAQLRAVVADGAITQQAAPSIYLLAKWLLAELRTAEEERRRAVAKVTGAEKELPQLEAAIRDKGEALCAELATFCAALQQAGRGYDASSIRQQVYNPIAKFIGQRV